ncbi:MAG: diguanylate cyclase [Acidimicrobiales bacterium]
MDRRAVLGAAAGLTGAVLGAVAAASGAAIPAGLAGVAALVAGVAAIAVGRVAVANRHRAEERAREVTALEARLSEEADARTDLEQQLASRIQLTAMRKGTQADALTDGTTGLFSEGYFTVALDARIAAARRNLKPVAVVVMEVIEGLQSGLPHPADPVKVARHITGTIREADTACRLMDGGYALVLEDTAETGAIWTVERIRRRLAEAEPGLTVWAGVACYPAHGFTTDEILDRADLALDMAREWRQDRIEVASAE